MQLYITDEFPEFDYIGTNFLLFEFNDLKEEELNKLINISLQQNKFIILANENPTEKRKK
jgi:hypothetical protein